MKNSSILFFSIFLLTVGCDEIFEEDLSNQVININHPLEFDTLSLGVVQVNWIELNDVDSYKIELTHKPDSMSNLFSIIDYSYTNIYEFNSYSGAYQFSIQAMNQNSTSNKTSVEFFVR